jgi:RNA recognition motif-containing protein
MQKKLYVRNVSQFTSEAELKATFAEYGAVVAVTLVVDQQTRKPTGSGFVEYETAEAARGGLLALNGAMLLGSMLSVDLDP